MLSRRMKTRAGAGHLPFVSACALLVVLTLCASAAFAQPPASRPATRADDGHADNSDGMLEGIYHAFHAVENWLVVGIALLAGRIGGKLTSRLRTPMVVGYLVVGVVLGRSVLNVIDAEATGRLEMVTDFGLGIVAFLIGTELSRKLIRRLGAKLIIIMVSESLAAVVVVGVLVWALSGWLLPAPGLAVAGALIFAAMAAASAPAGTVAVIQEYKAKGPMTSLLLGVVGLDDAFAIIIYAFAAAIAKVLLGSGELTFLSVAQGPCLEIMGGLLLGGAVGIVLLVLLWRRGGRTDVLVYTLGAILLTTGLANAMGLSLILANLAVGVVLANLSARDTDHAYNAIEAITVPVYVLFFVVAGAHLDLRLLAAMSLLGTVYVVARSIGKISGGYLGATAAKMKPVVRRYLGLGLLSQAGVAVGLALTVANEFRSPQYGQLGQQLASLTINTIAATTIVFEIIGPITTRIALSKAGEIGAAPKARGETP